MSFFDGDLSLQVDQTKGYIYISSFVLSLPNQYLCILEYSCYKINFVTEAALGSQI